MACVVLETAADPTAPGGFARVGRRAAYESRPPKCGPATVPPGAASMPRPRPRTKIVKEERTLVPIRIFALGSRTAADTIFREGSKRARYSTVQPPRMSGALEESFIAARRPAVFWDLWRSQPIDTISPCEPGRTRLSSPRGCPAIGRDADPETPPPRFGGRSTRIRWPVGAAALASPSWRPIRWVGIDWPAPSTGRT